MDNQTTKTLPSVSTLFEQSWVIFKKTALRLFVLHLIVGLGFFVLLIVFIIFGVFSGIGGAALFGGKGTNFSAAVPFLISGGAFLLLFLIAGIILGSFLHIGSILIIDQYTTPPSFSQIMSRTTQLILPGALIGLVAGLLTVGGFFVLFIPGIVFIFFFTFDYLELILNNKRGLSPLRRSVYIVKSHGWEILGRILLLWIISILIYGVFSVFGNMKALQPLVTILSIIVRVSFSWYSLAYTVTLYKQARESVDAHKESSLKPFVIIAAVGWLLLVLLIFGAINLIKSPAFQQGFRNSIQKNSRRFTPSPTQPTYQYR